MRRALACLIACSTIAALSLGCPEPRERERGEVIVNQDRRDKEELLTTLDVEIHSLDQQIRALENQQEGQAERDRLWERRDRLYGDREAVQYATGADWRVVKERAERDLKNQGPSRI